MATLGGILPYHGAKREMAPQIVSHFGPHDQYFEVFAGSLSVLFGKEPCRHEIVSEKNPDVANLIRCLSFPEDALNLYHRAKVHPVSESRFTVAAERIGLRVFDENRDDPLERAFDFLLVSWQGPSGLAGTTRKPRFAVRNTTSGGTVAARWRSVADSIPEWHERLRNVEFRCKDAFELIAACPDREGTVLYSDSPYHRESRTGGDYAFDFDKPMVVDGKERCQHEVLAESLARFKKTKVVVSHMSGPVIDDLYSSWRKVPIKATKKMKHTTGGTQDQVDAGEVVFINRD